MKQPHGLIRAPMPPQQGSGIIPRYTVPVGPMLRSPPSPSQRMVGPVTAHQQLQRIAPKSYNGPSNIAAPGARLSPRPRYPPPFSQRVITQYGKKLELNEFIFFLVFVSPA